MDWKWSYKKQNYPKKSEIRKLNLDAVLLAIELTWNCSLTRVKLLHVKEYFAMSQPYLKMSQPYLKMSQS